MKDGSRSLPLIEWDRFRARTRHHSSSLIRELKTTMKSTFQRLRGRRHLPRPQIIPTVEIRCFIKRCTSQYSQNDKLVVRNPFSMVQTRGAMAIVIARPESAGLFHLKGLTEQGQLQTPFKFRSSEEDKRQVLGRSVRRLPACHHQRLSSTSSSCHR